ncbi:uncharacterized protein LOC129571594 [Sitodiplosis mosellana]|uniref:uncharacterized protein LOC129571594 n=1 Tax=Sitodiplosis mosellana TaxID=263140 RepID=UPI0024437A64|nr:uncharacterized protein LOC129571594 [Sitodiplosis mosellana]
MAPPKMPRGSKPSRAKYQNNSPVTSSATLSRGTAVTVTATQAPIMNTNPTQAGPSGVNTITTPVAVTSSAVASNTVVVSQTNVPLMSTGAGNGHTSQSQETIGAGANSRMSVDGLSDGDNSDAYAPAQESKHSKHFKSAQSAMNRLADFANSDRMKTLSYEALQVLNERLIETWKGANASFDKLIEGINEGTGIEISYEYVMGQLEDTYFEISEKFRSRMAELERERANQFAQSNPASEAGGSAGERPIKVIVPVQQQNIVNTWGTFDGRPKDWPAFRDLSPLLFITTRMLKMDTNCLI